MVPTLRIFSLEKGARVLCRLSRLQSGLGEHSFEPDGPVYMQVSRGNLVLHLSEHHGDATPGSVALVHMKGIEEPYRELIDKKYRHDRPGLERMEWGMMQVTVTDPSGNRIRFSEPVET